MKPDFDPYYKWLGIPPDEQPPNHYRLLGLDRFESDAEVVDAATERLVTFLQDVAAGPHAQESQRLLNEIAAARLCLLDAEQKAAYDAQLSTKAQTPEVAPPPISVPAASSLSTSRLKIPLPEPHIATQAASKQPRSARAGTAAPRIADRQPRPTQLAWLALGVSVGAILVTVLLVVLLNGPSEQPPSQPGTPARMRDRLQTFGGPKVPVESDIPDFQPNFPPASFGTDKPAKKPRKQSKANKKRKR